MIERRTGVYPIKDLDYNGSLIFTDQYQLLDICYVRNVGPTPAKQYRGSFGEKTCCICDRTSATATFKKDAHILPACVGNRHLLSNEECDDCNKRFGDLFEDELGKFILDQRVFAGTRKRHGFPELRFPSNGSDDADLKQESKIVRGATGRMEIHCQEGNNNLRIEQSGDHTMRIVYTNPQTSRPALAILSLVHTAWLLFHPTQRKKYCELLDILERKNLILPFVFYHTWKPGVQGNYTSFRIWQKKETCDEPQPSIILQFNLGNTTLLWGVPNKEIGKYCPHILPPLAAGMFISEDVPSAKMTKWSLQSLDAQKPKQETYIEFKYKNMEEAHDDTDELHEDYRGQHSFNVPSSNGTLILTGEKEFTFNVKAQMELVDALFIVLSITGEELGIGINILEDEICRTRQMKVSTKLDQVSLENARRTICALSMVMEGTVRVRFHEVGKPGKMIDLWTLDKREITWDFVAATQLIDDLSIIAKEFNMDLRFPVDGIETHEIELLSNAIRYGVIKENLKEGYFCIRDATPELVNDLIEYRKETGGFTLWNSRTYNINGIELGPLESRIEVEKCDFGESVDELAKWVEETTKSEKRDITIKCCALVHVFSDWEKTPR